MNGKRREFIERFLEGHRIRQVSPAKLIYTAQKMDDTEAMKGELTLSEEAFLNGISSADSLHKCMRKTWSPAAADELRSRILDCEEEILPLIQEKCMKVGQETYIEDAIWFFLNTKYDPCQWIIENYQNFRSEYLKSLLCLVLGFRGQDGAAAFLMNEINRYELTYPNNDYEQGPLLGLYELEERF